MRTARIILASITFILSTFLFLDFAELVPIEVTAFTKIQIIPAIISGSISVLSLLFVLTLCFGRVYCSIICPMGILQDCISWISKKSNKKRQFKYKKEIVFLRYIILGLTGSALWYVVSILDPYSAFGRIIINIFRPLYLLINNLFAYILSYLGYYDIYHMDIYIIGTTALIVSITTLLIVGVMAWLSGRLYCNTICPVGTLLGSISRYSFMGIRIDSSKCGGCGLCEIKCKSSCIDSKTKSVDNSRCVSCFNCIDICKKGAIRYGTPVKKEVKKESATKIDDQSRRNFIATISVAAIATPKLFALDTLALINNKKNYKKQHPISPVGSISHAHLNARCTACGLCIARCPSMVLKPSGFEYGLPGMMQPKMDFEHGFCNFDCTLCSEICPNGALKPVTKEEKHTLQVGVVTFILDNCIVKTDETHCGACSEHCPTQAVSMIHYKDDLTIPFIHTDICVGCGGCEYVCPARPFKAIYIEGNPVHKKATPFKESEKKKDNVDDFGF